MIWVLVSYGEVVLCCDVLLFFGGVSLVVLYCCGFDPVISCVVIMLLFQRYDFMVWCGSVSPDCNGDIMLWLRVLSGLCWCGVV